MQKCCICGIRDQDYDRTGLQDETGYYCFNCKNNKPINLSKLDTVESMTKSEENTSASIPVADNNYISHTYQTNNTVASLIKGFSVFVGVIFFIIAISLSATFPDYSESQPFLLFLYVFGTGFVVSLFMYAAGEIVQLLHNIDMNTKK